MQADRNVRSMNWAAQDPALVPLLRSYAFMDVFVSDLDGNISLSRRGRHRDIKTGRTFSRCSREKSIISSRSRTVYEELTFFYASPVTNDGKIVGVLVAAENMAQCR